VAHPFNQQAFKGQKVQERGGGGGGATSLSGSGSPEGVQTADVGTIYTDLDPPYALWIKTAGSGNNTGWTQFLSL
jgi:hypothetical protein